MTLEIPFDPKTTLAQYRLRLNLAFKKNLNRTGINLLSAGIIIFAGWFGIGDKSNAGYFFLATGLFFLFNAITYLSYYWKMRKKHLRVCHEIIDLREKNNDTTLWEFRDDVLRYKDIYYDHYIKWEAFKGYKLVNGNLFLQLAESIDQSFILGENEIGAQEFAIVLTTVKMKMKNLPE